jgi:uncharacterized OB-fold protein
MADGDLTAPLVLEYPYTRTVGDVLGHWFTGLRDRRLEGIRAMDGRVIVPPQEYDPVTSETLSEWVTVGTSGQVMTWAWVPVALEDNPLDRPFAWALIRLDGADTALLHAVDAGSPEHMATGMRVQAKWRAKTEGSIRDIECFVPEESA